MPRKLYVLTTQTLHMWDAKQKKIKNYYNDEDDDDDDIEDGDYKRIDDDKVRP